MRRFKFLSYLISAMGLLTGCDLSYTVGEFWLCNESGQSLYIESSIASELTSETLSFVLEEGKENIMLIAKSPRYEDMQAEYLPLSHCVKNDDAKVVVYIIGDDGEKHSVHTWFYSNKDKEGRELFNEKCLTKDVNSFPDGGCFPSLTFTILPEDIVSN